MNIIRTVLIACALICFGFKSGKAQHLSARTSQVTIDTSVHAVNTGKLPIIEWVNPKNDFVSSQQNKLEIQVKVELFSPVKEIRLVVGDNNSTEVFGVKNIPFKPDVLTYDVKVPLLFMDGSNYVNLEVVTREGVIVSEKRTVLIGKGALDQALALDRKDYALLFCTDKYDNWSDLVNPIDDAHAIARELREKYGFIVEVVENPALEDIWNKLREYSEKKFSPQDQLMVFFAGHGQFDETFGEGYVVARNSLVNDPSRNSYLSHNRLRGVIDNIPCSHILLTMDVCFGGTLDPVIARHRGEVALTATTNEILARKWSYKARKYLTSGGKEYVSDGIPGKHSPFAATLLECLQGRGGADGLLTLSEIQAVMEKLKQLPRFGSFGSDEKQGDFVFVSKSRQ